MDVLTHLFRAALDACDDQNDTWNGRDLMVIVNLLRADLEGGKPVLMLSRVYNHALWNKVTFWEEVLLIGLCEAHSAEAVSRRSLPPGSQFKHIAMTSFLQRLLGYMMAFGISFDQGRNSVWATIRKNAALLGSTCKPYANALLQAYENLPQSIPGPVTGSASVGSAGSGGALPGQADHGVNGGPPHRVFSDGFSESPPAGLPPSMDSAEDDFEAVALGLPAVERHLTGGGESDNDEENSETEDGAGAGGGGIGDDHDRPAAHDKEENTVQAQTSADDVFI